MFRKLMCAVALFGFATAIAVAQVPDPPPVGQPPLGQQDKNLLRGRITKIQGNAVWVAPYNVTTRQFGEAKEYMIVGDDLRVLRMQGTKRVPVEGGLKADVFRNIGPKGQLGTFRLQQNRIAEIQLMDRFEPLPPRDGIRPPVRD
jgi:hypothetical protein